MDARLTTALAGRYDIEREIGRGGMATVYLARDVKHNRHVALKVLSAELGAVLGVERFLAEIEVTANLQHPNLLPLFDSGEAGGLLFYVMPFVEGESLRHRLARERQLPVEEAVRFAVAIANALDYAHRHKVIHRDLKPENILLHEGQPLVADFGIALAVSNAGGARVTQTGLSLGTPQYMSPEQATGDRAVDGRSDIYALAAMTYEMLVGDPPHVASTAQAIIAKVLTERPASVRAGRPSVPRHVEAAIARGLEKLAADRFTTAREFAEALEGKGGGTFGDGADARWSDGGAESRAASRASRALIATTVVSLGLAVAAAGWAVRRSGDGASAGDSPVIRERLVLPDDHRIAEALSGTMVAVSPRGDLVAYLTRSREGYRLFTKRVDELLARDISVRSTTPRNLAFSPDGEWLAFTEGSVIHKVPVRGGEPVQIGTTPFVPYGLLWAPGDTIYAGAFGGIVALAVTGGGAVPLLPAGDPTGARRGARWPVLLPGGPAIVFATGSGTGSLSQLGVLDLTTRRVVEYPLPLAVPLGVVDDHLVYVTIGGELTVVEIDRRTGRPLGNPRAMDSGILVDGTAGVKGMLSASGTLSLVKGRAELLPVLVDPATGRESALITEARTYASPRFSPSGEQVAMTLFTAASTDIHVYDRTRNTFSRLTTSGVNLRPEWTADGREIVYVSQQVGPSGVVEPAIMRVPADRSGPPRLAYRGDLEPFEAVVSPDSRWLVVRTAPGVRYSRDILVKSFEGSDSLRPLVTGPETEAQPRISPNGRWMAFQSNESGRHEIYVRPFPDDAGPIQVSTAGGTEPIWSRDGRSLYFRGPLGEVIRTNATTTGGFAIADRRELLRGEYLLDSSHPSWDVAPDGRLLMLKRAGGETEVILAHNWASLLRERAAAPR